MSRYYIRQDEQFDYTNNEDPYYHLFDREQFNEFGDDFCILAFATHSECQMKKQELEKINPNSLKN